MQMDALVLTGYGQFEFCRVPVPEIGPDEVLVEVKACSICGSDIHGCDGSSGRRIPPIVMGHEAAGVIAEVGEAVLSWRAGMRVTFDSTNYCGTCPHCLAGRTNVCQNRRVVGVSCPEYRKQGAMAQYVAVSAGALYKLPDQVPFEQACLCEPLAVGLHRVAVSPQLPGDTVAVIGDGTIGLMTLMGARASGSGHAVLLGHHPYRLGLALEMGADTVFQSNDALTHIKEMTMGLGADVVYDAVGTQSSIDTSLALVRDGGAVVLIGNAMQEVSLPLQSCIVRQIALLGSYNSAGEFPRCLALIGEGKVNLEPFTRARMPLSRGAEAFQRLLAREQGLLKVILEP